MLFFVFFFKQKTAYEMRISDWSSDVCSSDLTVPNRFDARTGYDRGDMSARRATIADVAREAGVSPSTASVVFSGRTPVSDGTRQRVLDAAAQLGYTGPDPRAASLRRGRSGIVGVVIEGRLGSVFSAPVMTLQMDGLTEGVARAGAGLLLLRDRGEEEAEPSLVTAPLDAAVLIGCNARTRESLAVLRARNVPVVVIEGDGGPGVPPIRLDNREAQRQLASHLARSEENTSEL